jgi:hypothetical protein
MTFHLRLFILAALASLTTCAPPPSTCNEQNCRGCCDRFNECRVGSIDSQCGVGGVQCRECQPVEQCIVGACTTRSTSSGGGTGGASAGGSSSTGGGASGGASTGGGEAGGSTAGGTSGGTSTAGGASGGSSTAGGASGGSSTAGGASGGSPTAGGASGGSSTAGGASGGSPTAGGASGGSSTAGGASGGTSTAGGTAGGTSTAGGSAGGFSTAGGSTAGGSSTGGGAAGGFVSDGGTVLCPPDFHACNAQCVSNAAVTSCGRSCSPCPAPANASALCGGGQCTFVCNAGFRRCNGSCVAASTLTAELCTDGLDNDCNGAIDCSDTSCLANPACANVAIGQGCASSSQCASGVCRTEATTGWPGGACVAGVNTCVRADAGVSLGCPTGAVCATDQAGTFCRQACSGAGSSPCRPGYACHDDDDRLSTAAYCVPLCTSDEQCSNSSVGVGCNQWSKRCEARDKGLAKYGAACNANSQCETGLCLNASNNGGYCYGVCNSTASAATACADDGVCESYLTSALVDQTARCLDGCTTTSSSSECRANAAQTCQIISSSGSTPRACYCRVVNKTCSGHSECCSGLCLQAITGLPGYCL